MKCKKLLNNVINRMLDPIRARRHEYEQDIPEIFNILKKGSESARETAAQTMSEVRKAMQIDYFNDAALIQQQAEKFKKQALCFSMLKKNTQQVKIIKGIPFGMPFFYYLCAV